MGTEFPEGADPYLRPFGAGIVRLLAAALIVLSCGAAASPAASPAAAGPQRTLVVGSEQDFPPFAVGMTDATADGFTVALWKAVAAEQKLDYVIRVRPFDEILHGFKSGSVDVLINLAQSDERRRFADFSVTHVEVGGAIFVRRGDRRLHEEAELAGRSLIVIRGDLAHDYAVAKGWGEHLVLVDTVEAGLRRLALGEHDAMLVTKLAGLQTIRQQQIDGVQALDARVGYSQRFAIAVRKGDSELLARINEGLALVKAHGDYDRLHQHWFGVYEDRPRDWKEFWPLLATAALLAGLALGAARLRRLGAERRAAADLRDSEERWKFALEGAGDGVWDADLVAGRTLYSHRWKAMLGYRDDEIGHAPGEWTGRIHPDDLPRVIEENRACIEGRSELLVSEFRMRAKEGHWVWILDRGKVVRRGAHGQALRMIGTHSDITDRKIAEAHAAAHAAAMLSLATGASLPDILAAIIRTAESTGQWQCAVLLLDEAGKGLEAAAPSLPVTFVQGLCKAFAATPAAGWAAALRSGLRRIAGDLQADADWQTMAGPAQQAGWRACWQEPVLGSDATVLGAFVAFRRRTGMPGSAETDHIVEAAQIASIAIERRRGEQALQDREERLQRALDASWLALWDFDLETGEVYLSDAWSEMLGGTRQATRTTFEALTALVPPEDQVRIGVAMADALSGRTRSYQVEHRVQRPDGGTLWVLSQGRVVERGSDGKVRRAVGTNRDITERKNAQFTQAKLEAQLREAQKLEAIGTLAGGIAHDFNNIMAAILGNVAFAQQDLGAEHPVQSHLQQIARAGRRARSLVQQILAFSRKQTDEMVVQPLAPMIEETVAMLRPTVGKSATLDVVLPASALHVKANLTQLQQVLLNLGTNAWQALPGGAGPIEIGLAEASVDEGEGRAVGVSPGAWAHLWVRDGGCGMDDATRRRIFEPFFTTKPFGQGTGLGLAVVHGIVEAHGGTISVTTAPGRGSTFDIYLPLAEQRSPLAPPEPDVAEPRQGAGEHVLYVDDDEVMAVMVRGLLERLGYRATCLMDAEEAIATVARAPQAVDLVVTDFNMPAVSGLDVARALAGIRSNLPVLISSGYVSDDLCSDAAALGVRSVLRKERTLEELGVLVHETLASARRPAASA